MELFVCFVLLINLFEYSNGDRSKCLYVKCDFYHIRANTSRDFNICHTLGCGQRYLDRKGTVKKVSRNGDSKARIEEFPWMMSIASFDSDGEIRNRCSGTLISKDFVLTAAHCLDNVKLEALGLVFGTDDLADSNSFYRVERDIGQTFVHPNYDKRFHYFDVALIKSSSPLDFNAGIYPVCLPERASNEVDNRRGNAVTLTGFGAESKESRENQKLRFAQLTVYSQAFCNGRYSSVGREFEDIIRESLPQKFQSNILCAGYEVSMISTYKIGFE